MSLRVAYDSSIKVNGQYSIRENVKEHALCAHTAIVYTCVCMASVSTATRMRLTDHNQSP